MSERLHGTFPDELRIEGAGNVLEAGGRRAHAVAREGGIDVRIDGWSAHLRSDARAPALRD